MSPLKEAFEAFVAAEGDAGLSPEFIALSKAVNEVSDKELRTDREKFVDTLTDLGIPFTLDQVKDPLVNGGGVEFYFSFGDDDKFLFMGGYLE